MKKLIPCLLLAAVLPLSAQISLNAQNRKDQPIVINSDAMDIDMKSGKATFYGNVVVNDPEVIINCDKMVLYQEKNKEKDKKDKKDKKKKGDDKNKKKGSSSLEEDQKLDRIECIDNVVITRKNFQSRGTNQRGTCGKATYFHKLGKITMEIEPVLYQDDSKITGTTLSFFQSSERVSGTDIKIEARNLQQEKEDAGNKSSSNKKAN